ncbi:ABC transporter ATP-binding protein [Sandaracinus amylolyticus]|uniref:Macrolide export ATP-binding/permease protein MacB n=1 Tax=Sandaracinus amylolyticus TaxID=927083 RepID=A0A0F6YNH7_9BACT|nr:ABC transporter ATP-binding protein [Sandaracinus amylolyticus]AKF10457.1 Macrolide export ATP-binding/permease protein MacB [Sandaracinus amylolyticus]
MTTSLLELRKVERVYGHGDAEVRALDGVDLAIGRAEFVAVMGSSGSGKSTCMNILGCLDQPTGGEYLFDGVSVGGLDRDQRAMLRRLHLGFVFQGFNLLARTSALENVELPLLYRGVRSDERRARAMSSLERVGLADRARHMPSELSGGQQQRVAIARALVTDPAVILADEPTGNLDSQRSVEIMQLLQRLHREQSITIVMVTHEPDMAAYCERLVTFRDGRILSDAKNEAPS